MDPSEFEGTVEKSESVLDAGALEVIFQTDVATSKFTFIDVSKEIGDLHLAIYNIQQTAEKESESWRQGLTDELDATAVKITELKESYLNRRKNLTKAVKDFTSTHLGEEKNDEATIACRDILRMFKKEFDGLASLSKFSENSFFDLYKKVRELPNAVDTVKTSLSLCLKIQDLLTKTQEQMINARDALTEAKPSNVQGFGNQSALIRQHQQEIEKLQRKMESEQENLNQQYMSDIATLKANFEIDLRNRELTLKNSYEREHLALQEKYDVILTKKDSELDALLHSLQELQQKNTEADERSRLLDIEMANRRELEDKWRASVLKISDLNGVNQDLSQNIERLKKEMSALQARIDSQCVEYESQTRDLKSQIELWKQKSEHALNDLARLPPLDLSTFIERMNNIAAVRQAFLSIGYSDGDVVRWDKVEAVLLEGLRKQEAEITQYRVKYQDSNAQVMEYASKCDSLQRQLSEQVALTSSLEHDLLTLHDSITRNKGSDVSLDTKNVAREQISSTSRASSMMTSVDLEDARSNSDKILVTVQSQRDRYMKASKDKDAELQLLRAQLGTMEEEQHKLRSENLELYRRLRVLRISLGAQGGGATGQSSTNQDSSGFRGRKSTFDEKSSTDIDLDEKYLSLYEGNISPFRVEELDRQLMLSRLNIFEQGLAYINRHIMQDRWARHALLAYLAFVHFLALIYVWNVLNPELIEEVDAHMKARWSSETLNMPEHPDI